MIKEKNKDEENDSEKEKETDDGHIIFIDRLEINKDKECKEEKK